MNGSFRPIPAITGEATLGSLRRVGKQGYSPGLVEKERRYRLLVFGSGLLLAAGLTATAAVAQPNTGNWLDLFFSTLILPVLAVGALASMILRRALVGPANERTLQPQRWLMAWGYILLTFAVAFVCLIVVVIVALVIARSKVTAFAEALTALVAAYVSLRLLGAIVANTVVLKRKR